ncbi:hypothetical protein DDI_0373 [Dickeya dianthicola RNS04.9]|nr:hypothetical protein DDI_0373 [Dickeya dianthicola RNS04.9]
MWRMTVWAGSVWDSQYCNWLYIRGRYIQVNKALLYFK